MDTFDLHSSLAVSLSPIYNIKMSLSSFNQNKQILWLFDSHNICYTFAHLKRAFKGRFFLFPCDI